MRLLISIISVFAISCSGQVTEPDQQRPGEQVQADTLKEKGPVNLYPNQQESGNYAPDEVFVKFKKGTDKHSIEVIQRELNLETIRVFSTPDLYLMRIQDGRSVEKIIILLKNSKAVLYSEPNYAIKVNPR